MAPPRFAVRVTKDYCVFSCAHFITFAGNHCERLHGHNYRVDVRVTGPLDENHYVVDFLALRDWTKALCDRLDHHVLLPTQSSLIHISQEEKRVVARFADREWIFPLEDCVLLPIANTTAELIALWMGEELKRNLSASGTTGLESITVSVEENFGQWADCTLTWAN